MQLRNNHNFRTLTVFLKKYTLKKNHQQQENGLRWLDHILFNYETMSDKQFEEVNLQGSITDQFED